MTEPKQSTDNNVEHLSSTSLHPVLDIHEFDETTGYIVDAERADQHGLKLASDGHTILVPQPSDDPQDPLNWSSFKKHFILLVVAATAFLPESSSTTGAVDVLPQAAIWHLSENEINHATSGNVFMIGAGGVFVVTLSAYFGRLPVLFWCLLLTLLTIIWCGAATSFESYMAARILNGFFAVAGEAGATMWINDLFFFHEKAQKINIFAYFILNAVFIGPLFSAFMLTTQSWRTTFWLATAEVALCFTLVLLFFDESYYDRRLRPDQQPPRKTRLHRLIGIQQFQSRHTRNSWKETILRPIKAVSRPTVLISVFYTFFTFSWFVGISATISIFLTPLYDFGLLQIGYMYFAPIVGTTIGYLIGIFLHDWIANVYIKRHQGHFEPEVRLWSMWVATPLMVSGLVLLGFSLERRYHYMVTAVAWALFNAGTVISSVALNAYNLDSYPEASGEIGAWLTFGRATSGFVASYFQIPWAFASGMRVMFGIEAGIVVCGLLLAIGLQIYGKRMRVWSGSLNFHTA